VYTVTTSLASSPGVCPTTDQVAVTVYPTIQTNLNVLICDNSSYNFGNNALNTPGTYIDSLTTIHGCDSVVTLNLSVNPTFLDTISAEICQDTAYTFGSQQLSTAGTYTNIFQSVSGCDSTIVLLLTVNTLPIVICPDTLICLGDTATLIPQGTLNYSWSPSNGTISQNGALTFSPTQTTAVQLTGTDSNGCSNLINVLITVQQPPNIILTLSDNPACFGDTIIATVFGGVSYSWQSPTFFNSSLSSQSSVALQNEVFSIIGFDNLGCSSEDSVVLLVNPLPILQITPNQSICAGDYAQINISGAVIYTWEPQGSGSSSQFSPLFSTNYFVSGIDANGCENSISTEIVVNPNPIAGLSAEPTITTSDSPEITFTNFSEGATQYYFDLGDGNLVEEPLPTIYEHVYPFAEGNYKVYLLVENEFGCTDSTTLYIQVKGDEIFYIPNTFTPDGDEHNNIFTPIFTTGFDPANFQMEIYNRWGELFFQSFNANKGWDGYFDGKLAPLGTYIWKIRYKNPDLDDYKDITGHVNLIR
jgi:gliding motility-associated-like protein